MPGTPAAILAGQESLIFLFIITSTFKKHSSLELVEVGSQNEPCIFSG